MKKTIIAVAGVFILWVILAFTLVIGGCATPAHSITKVFSFSTSHPLTCVNVKMENGPQTGAAYVKFCGQYAGTPAPVKSWATFMFMDGTRSISRANCPQNNPCVVLAPQDN